MSNRLEERNNYFIDGLKSTAMKTHRVRINPGIDERIQVIYEAYADTKHNQECNATVYCYDDGTDEPSYTIEKKAKWDGAWDTKAEADATALGYDLKVNGEL